MADFYMHRMLIGQIQETIGYSDESTIGAQGPDYFYYVIGANKPAAMDVGNRIHKSHTRSFLVTMLEVAIKQQSSDILQYVCGFLSHHALDISIHPYIFYYTGLYQEKDPSTHQWAGLHLQFERKVDIAFIKKHRHIQPNRHMLFKQTLPLNALNAPIQTAIEHSVLRTFGVAGAADLFNQGYQMMRRVGRFIVFDPFTLKRKLLGVFESYHTPKSTYFQDLSHAQKTSDFDYLNDQASPWLHPVTGETQTLSVDAIFNQAYDLSMAYIDAALKGFEASDTTPLEKVLRNASYDTGLPVTTDQTMRHFKDYRTIIK